MTAQVSTSFMDVLPTILINDARMRFRRSSTFIILAVLVLLSWTIIPDPQTGKTLMAVGGARVVYTSATLALGSAVTFGILFGLAGFYLLRGRVDEDLQLGLGEVIASTPLSNLAFLFSRWLSGVLYLSLLLTGLLATTLIYHLLRGEGAIDPSIYIQTYCLLLLPSVFFNSASALLFDSIPMLMGKLGDLLFFGIWIAQIVLVATLDHSTPVSTSFHPILAADFLGLGSGMMILVNQLHTSHYSIGVVSFNSALPSVNLTHFTWSYSMLITRAISAVFALIPIFPTCLFFHRYSSDRIKVSKSTGRRKLLTSINRQLRPLTQLIDPLFSLASRTSDSNAHILAEIAVSFSSFPLAMLALGMGYATSILVSDNQLPAALAAIITFWGIFISDISCRDHRARMDAMVCSTLGGRQAQNHCQFIATWILGLLFVLPFIVRLAFQPATPQSNSFVNIASLLTGLFGLSALANLLGRSTGSSRLFMTLFLFCLYASLNAKTIPYLDAFGFNGAANWYSIGMYVLIGLTTWLASILYQIRQDHQ